MFGHKEMGWPGARDSKWGNSMKSSGRASKGPPGRRVVHIETSVIVQAKDMGSCSWAVAMRTERRLKGTARRCQTRPRLKRRSGKSRWF